MPPSPSTGLFLALGAAAGVAAASLLAPSGSRNHAGSCASCGRSMVGHGGRGSLAKKEEDVRGTYLLRQRYEARAGFVLPVETIDALNAGYADFRRETFAEVRQALAATVFERARASRKSLKTRVSQKSTRSSRKSQKSRRTGSRARAVALPFTVDYGSAFLHMEAEQRAILDANGFGPRVGPIKNSRQLESRPIMDYVSEKVSDWRAAQVRRERAAAKAAAMGKTSASTFRGPRTMEEAALHYAANLYVSRAWTIYVCRETGHLAARDRLAAYRSPGTRDSTLFEGVRFEIVLPALPLLPRPAGVLAPLSLSGARRTRADRDLEAQAAETADLLEEAGDDEDAKLLKGMAGMPYLRMLDGSGRAVGFYFVADIGSMYFTRGQQVIPLLTTTSKMASPSFGLPAGLAEFGGTCPGAGVKDDVGLEKNRICSICYATSANYGYANNLTQQLARQLWVSQVLADEGSASLGYDLACMVEAYARSCRHTDRSGQEIGTWAGDQDGLRVPSGRGVRRAKCTWLQVKSLDGEPVPSNTYRLFAGQGIPGGDVAGFFRVHDSGDFGVMVNGKLGTAQYVEAWRIAAELLPSVYFWAPSRIWPMRRSTSNVSPQSRAWLSAGRGVAEAATSGRARRTTTTRPFRFDGEAGDCSAGSANRGPSRAGSRSVESADGLVDPGVSPVACSPDEELLLNREVDERERIHLVPAPQMVNLLASLGALPNFSVRPSGVYMKREADDPVTVPTIRALHAGQPVVLVGSGVAAQTPGPGHHYPLMVDTRGVVAWQCPVYTVQPPLPGETEGREAKSCRAANCRACWIAKDLPIFYGAH